MTNLEIILTQKEICETIEKAFLAGKMQMTSTEGELVWRCKRHDRPLKTWHLSALKTLAKRISS